ncbi:hypothetical protein D3C87_1682030 [compost metagenome]
MEDETLIVDLIANQINDDHGNLIFAVENFSILGTYMDQMNYFLTCLKRNEKPMNSLNESIGILKTCLSNEF